MDDGGFEFIETKVEIVKPLRWSKIRGCVCTLNIPIRRLSMILKQVNQEIQF
jgi:hypothetical protein